MLAALLTAFVRPTLPLAPAFSADAPMAATGKTLLWRCLLRLCGTNSAVIPECKNDDEFRKRLLAVLREGRPGFLLDNIRGPFKSSALEAFLTAESFTDRVLGLSKSLTFPTCVMVLISGNNFLPEGDLYRRILTARMDAGTEDPERRSFAADPLEHCRVHRQEMVSAGLTLLRGFISAGKPRATDDRLPSFEAWDDLIRQAAIWLGAQGIAEVADPAHCIAEAKKLEPGRLALGLFRTRFGRHVARPPGEQKT